MVDAVKPGETLKTHSGGYRAEVVTPSGTKIFKHVHFCKHSDDHTVAFVVDGDPPELTNHQNIFTCDENGNRKLVGQMNDGIFEPGEAIANKVIVVNSRT